MKERVKDLAYYLGHPTCMSSFKSSLCIWYEHQTRKVTNHNSFPATGDFCNDVYEDLCKQFGPRSGPGFCDDRNCLTLLLGSKLFNAFKGIQNMFDTDGIPERF